MQRQERTTFGAAKVTAGADDCRKSRSDGTAAGRRQRSSAVGSSNGSGSDYEISTAHSVVMPVLMTMVRMKNNVTKSFETRRNRQ